MLRFMIWSQRFRRIALRGSFPVLIALLLVVTQMLHGVAPVYAQHDPEFNPNMILLGVNHGTSEDEIRKLLQSYGLELSQFWPKFGLAAASSPAGSISAASTSMLHTTGAALVASDLIRYVAPDQRIYAASQATAPIHVSQVQTLLEPPLVEPAPNDPRFSEQYAFQNMHVVDAWNITKGSEDVVIGVIDSGYDSAHSDIDQSSIWTNTAELEGKAGVDDDKNGFVDDIHGWDWVDDDNLPNDPYGHGTHVSGVIIAEPDNGIGISGMAPNLRVASLRVLDQRGGGFISDLINALAYAETFHFPIVNLSLVIISDSPAIYDAVQGARAAGIVIVAATGNVSSLVQWPAAYAETVAVAATDSLDTRASFSGQGTAVDVAAPGVSILSTYRDNAYAELSGTSMATPQVSALLGLLLSLRPDLEALDLITLLKSTAEDVNSESLPGPDTEIGAGRINYYSALLTASESLSIDPASLSSRFVQMGAEVNYPVRITAPGSLPVHGATVFVSATLTTSQSIPRLQLQTDRNGLISVPIQAPQEQGNYSFDVQIGAASALMPVTVYTAPVTLTLTMSNTVMPAGAQGMPFHINLFDQFGALQPGPAPIRLNTTRGTFTNMSQTYEILVTDGEYIGSLDAGATIGTGQFSATIGNLSDAVNLRVLPGSPAQIDGEDQFLPLVSDASTRLYKLTFSVADAFGNPVLDDTLVRVSTSEGKLTPVDLRTVDGEVATQLALPSGASKAIVRAVIPGTALEKSITIAIPLSVYWLPLISNAHPAK